MNADNTPDASVATEPALSEGQQILSKMLSADATEDEKWQLIRMMCDDPAMKRAMLLALATAPPKPKVAKPSHRQILARLVWAGRLCGWGNVQVEMRNVINGLIRRGLITRDRLRTPAENRRYNAIDLTEAGEKLLDDAGILVPGRPQDLVPDAQFWVDQWGTTVPA
jgi:hypothetical protein